MYTWNKLFENTKVQKGKRYHDIVPGLLCIYKATDFLCVTEVTNPGSNLLYTVCVLSVSTDKVVLIVSRSSINHYYYGTE